jgi:hypothetical protein
VLNQIVVIQERIGDASNPANAFPSTDGGAHPAVTSRTSGYKDRLPHFVRPMATRAFEPEVVYRPDIFALGC